VIVDIFITAKNRAGLLKNTLNSLKRSTDRSLFRLTVVQDGDYTATARVIDEFVVNGLVDHYLLHKETQGLGPSINQALAHIDVLNKYLLYDQKLQTGSKDVPFVCYVQDDVIFTPGWLDKLAKMFMLYEKQYKLGFASGVECIEHPVKKDLGNGIILKDWIRATCMFARREYWMSMFPITRFDPETGRERGMPNDGMGSSVDWWFIRDHQNSVCKTNRTCLVIPGLIVHAGYNDSTWLKRELPESQSDKDFIDKSIK